MDRFVCENMHRKACSRPSAVRIHSQYSTLVTTIKTTGQRKRGVLVVVHHARVVVQDRSKSPKTLTTTKPGIFGKSKTLARLNSAKIDEE
jgi:hypothetical protein